MPDAPPEVTMTITMRHSGEMAVSGPIQNKILCYGMLEIARQCIQDHGKGDDPVIAVPRLRFNGGLDG